MQTIYCSTSNFIRHKGNLVDLDEFRHKLELLQEGSLAPRIDPVEQNTASKSVQSRPAVTLLPTPPARHRKQHRERASWILDACASLAVILMTVSVTLSILF